MSRVFILVAPTDLNTSVKECTVAVAEEGHSYWAGVSARPTPGQGGAGWRAGTQRRVSAQKQDFAG